MKQNRTSDMEWRSIGGASHPNEPHARAWLPNVGRFVVPFILLFITSGTILTIADLLAFISITHDGPTLRPRVLTVADEAWWRDRFGSLPEPSSIKTVPPPTPLAQPGPWLIRRGGNGASELKMIGPIGKPISLMAWEIVPAPPYEKGSLLRSRVLASIDGQSAYRVGVALPFVMLQREYAGPSSKPVPEYSSPEWTMRVRPLAFLANTALGTIALAVPVILLLVCFRIARGFVRAMRKQCTACGYRLDGLMSENCPECGHKRRRASACTS